MRIDDPWHDTLASGWAEETGPPAGPPPVVPAAAVERAAGRNDPPDRPETDAAAVYLAVRRSAAFRRIRARHRRFVLPASAAFLLWYLACLVAVTVAPDLMARPVAGVLNVGMAAGLGQFATTFLLTWAYVRHARLRRDRAALDLRWETQDMTRTTARESSR